MIAAVGVEPVGEGGDGGEMSLSEGGEGGVVRFADDGVERVETKVLGGVPFEQGDGCGAVAFPLVCFQEGDADLGAGVEGGEVRQVDEADGRGVVFDDEAERAAFIDGCGGGDILLQRIAGVGALAVCGVPERGVVLDGVEEREVFGLKGAEAYQGMGRLRFGEGSR